jgi:hypothetical protein
MAGENERNDVNLCFQALGLDFGASPEEVDKAYQRLLAEIAKKQSSADPARRAEAATDLALANDLYDKIRNSLTYNTQLKASSHAAALKEPAGKNNPLNFKICPSCGKMIGAALTKCPYCREPIRTPFEAFMHKVFSGTSLVIIIFLIILTVAGVLFVTYRDILKQPTEAPVAVPPLSGSFSNQSGSAQQPAATGSFGNQTGSAQKP